MRPSDFYCVILSITILFSGIVSAQNISLEPSFRFPGTFFPAFAISAAGKDLKGPIENAEAYGFISSGSFAMKVIGAPENSRIKVQVEIPEIGVSGELEIDSLQNRGTKTLIPRLSWSEKRLIAISQPFSSEIIFRAYVNGALSRELRQTVRIRAINDAPLSACETPQKCGDYSNYVAAFVNENHPAIDQILRAALEIPAIPIKRWTGTQGTEEEVLMQVWAIWYLFQRNKVTYSSITTTSDERQDVFSQTIRPLSQTLRTAQANCIDGTALFASILRKIGIEPLIVLVPGHAFLGFFIDPQQRKPVFLETTMLNASNNPFNQRGPTKPGIALSRLLGNDIHMKRSWQSFVEAMNEGHHKYASAAPNFGKQRQFKIIPIKNARLSGILPLPL